MANRIMCANCRLIVDFMAYDMTLANGTEVKSVVAVNEHGNYLCKECMEVARKSGGAIPCNLVPVTQYVAAHQVAQLSKMTVLAEDLLMQLVNHDDDSSHSHSDLIKSANEWLDNYKAFRVQQAGESDGN